VINKVCVYEEGCIYVKKCVCKKEKKERKKGGRVEK
jgi:hypothetical protein